MATITKEEYDAQLSAYVTEQMATLPQGRKTLKFWVEFNKTQQENFDLQLAANGVTVEHA